MKRSLQFLDRGARGILAIVGSFVLWTVWLALVLLLALQLYVLSANELALPKFALRILETRLEESGLRATFSRTSFDPTGRILVENARLSLPSISEPILTARSVFVRLNPWMLVVGRFEPREIRIVGATASVPAMLSPSGQPVEIVSQTDATLAPADKTFVIHQLSGRVAGVVVSARGTLVLPPPTGKPVEQAIAEFVRNRFPTLCRQALHVAQQAAKFEQPEVHLEFSPSESGAAAMSVTVLARTARLEQPIVARAAQLRARTRLLLFGENPTSWLEFSARELDLPGGVRARGVQGDVYGRFQGGAFFFEPRELTLTADRVEASGLAVQAISGRVFPRPLPRVDVDAVARIDGAPLSVHAEADLKAQQGRAAFEGEIAPAILTPLSERLRVDVRKFFDFTRLAIDRGEVRIGERAKFESLQARVRVDGVNAYGVKMTDGRAIIELDPTRFYSPDAFARVGDNFARGSYEQDLKTLEYRFLLQGRLRPMELSPWFREWWPNFFRQLEFPEAPPAASVDVRGFWREGNRTSVFVFADAARPVLRGTALDRTRTRLFIRPAFFDVLELFATRGEGLARGRFTFIAEPVNHDWKSFDFVAESSLDLPTLASLGGDEGREFLQPFHVAQPPALKASGRLLSATDGNNGHREIRVETRTKGEFRFHDFPLHDAAFVAAYKNDELTIDDFEATVAGGRAAGHARVWTAAEQRRLGFDLSLNEASLGQVAGTLQAYFAQQKGLPPPPPGRFVQEKANVKLDFAASAEGRYDDPLSFRGEGSATLAGPEIAEISLLGALSELLKFTSLRFTDAQTNFKIEGPKITFPEVKFRGPSAAIDAHGTYALGPRELDFNAKIFPFQESENLIKTVVGAVLTPISNTFEVKLGGSLDKPEWALAISPGNLLRSLTPGESAEKTSDKAAPGVTPEPKS